VLPQDLLAAREVPIHPQLLIVAMLRSLEVVLGTLQVFLQARDLGAQAGHRGSAALSLVAPHSGNQAQGCSPYLSLLFFLLHSVFPVSLRLEVQDVLLSALRRWNHRKEKPAKVTRVASKTEQSGPKCLRRREGRRE